MSASKFSTYDQVGQVEDISDVISMITPSDVPFQTMIKSGSTKSKLVQWQEDVLYPAADNAYPEGSDAPTASHSGTTMRTNTTQIMMESVKVTATAQAIDLYGRDDELARELSKKGRKLKMDLEKALVGVVQTKVTGDDSTARRFDNVYTQISSATTNDNAGTNRALAESQVLDVSQKLYDEGGEASILMVRPKDTGTVADWAYKITNSAVESRGRPMASGSTTIVHAVDVYKTPVGHTLKVTPNRHMKNATKAEALVFSPSSWKLRWLRKWLKEKLAKTGDYDGYMLVGEMTLVHANQKISGRITDLTPFS